MKISYFPGCTLKTTAKNFEEKEQKDTRVVTLCSMCYNTLKRANNLVKEDEEKLNKLNDFMYRENVKYDGKVEVLHLLEVLKNEVGFSEVAKKVKRSLKGLRVANYYGCLLLRNVVVLIILWLMLIWLLNEPTIS